jgi:hypothetical protein
MVTLTDIRDGQPLRVGQKVTFIVAGPDRLGRLLARDVKRE